MWHIPQWVMSISTSSSRQTVAVMVCVLALLALLALWQHGSAKALPGGVVVVREGLIGWRSTTLPDNVGWLPWVVDPTRLAATVALSMVVVGAAAIACVRAGWYPRVRLERLRFWRRRRNRCTSCGYPLRGLTSGRCPECGTAYDAPEVQGSEACG